VSLAIPGLRAEGSAGREEIGQQALPGVVVPDAWQGAAGAGKVAEPWLGTFGDPHLEQLVGEAFAYNPDLQLAAARVEEAAANVTAAEAVSDLSSMHLDAEAASSAATSRHVRRAAARNVGNGRMGPAAIRAAR
jgi:outer membrane protein TolC